jgi:ribosome-associated toxin RatA of RatAB toxin-antitoxin module
MGQSVTDSTTIDAPAATVFEVIVDLESYPDWAEGMLEAEILSRDDEGRPEQARFKVDARVAEVTYTLRYRYEGHDVRWALVEGETVSQLDGSYELTDNGSSTDVRYSLEADVDMPLPGFLKKRATRTILDQGLRGLKRRAESQA